MGGQGGAARLPPAPWVEAMQASRSGGCVRPTPEHWVVCNLLCQRCVVQDGPKRVLSSAAGRATLGATLGTGWAGLGRCMQLRGSSLGPDPAVQDGLESVTSSTSRQLEEVRVVV
eukprot:48340-Chlamydomonas_euryale.AAC.1